MCGYCGYAAQHHWQGARVWLRLQNTVLETEIHKIVIEIEKLQMTGTVITVVLHELIDIQVQIRSNENSYLNLRKGMLANN